MAGGYDIGLGKIQKKPYGGGGGGGVASTTPLPVYTVVKKILRVAGATLNDG